MSVSRRELLAGACAAGAAGLLAGRGEAAGAAAGDVAAGVAASAAGGFSFVHLTDQHVTDRRHAVEGYRQCIASINALDAGAGVRAHGRRHGV